MGIGPSTKETTLHRFRDPILEVCQGDQDIDLTGIIVVGTPSSMDEKEYVAARTGMCVEAMRLDGAIVTIDGWGNSHVDFALTMEQIGSRGVEVVGVTFQGTQASFVIKNEFMNTIVDINKSKAGIETECVGENTAVELDAKKALALLKLKMR